MDNLLDGAHRLGIKIEKWAKNKIKKQIWRNLKGSLKDPFLYMRAIAVILFLVVSFSAPSNNITSPIFTEGSQNSGDPFVVSGAEIKESPDLSLIQKNSLTAISPPIMVTPQVLGALIEGANYEWIQQEVIEYVVQPGDNLGAIAEKFDISLDTILWANDLNKYSLIQIGQKLVILPTSGVVHHVKEGDTLSQIAKTYKAETDKIINFNDLATEGDIYIGDILIVPDGIMPPPTIYAPSYVPLAQSYFICPISLPCQITQGPHWYNAIDFSHGKCGEPIYAVAGGEIQKTGYGERFGNYVRILHPNGVVTYYGHLQSIVVSSGQQVSQGKIIGYMGYTGYTIPAGPAGCHLHFGVSGTRNPFAK